MKPWFWMLWLLAAVGCAKSGRSVAEYDITRGALSDATGYETLQAEAEAEYAPSRKARAGRTAAPPAPPPSTTVSPVEPPRPDRMVHYDGFARMRATRPSETVDAVAKLATDVGGRVDRLTDTQATVRVPVASFDEVWAAVLDLGDVLSKQVRADDITDQFRDIDLRVKTLRTMQQRLIRLLSRARTEEEKLALLEQITRVTEELDRTESQLRALRDLASMSRISVAVEPRELGRQQAEGLVLSGFEWLRSLSPFNRSVWGDDKRIELPTPDEMVSLTKNGPWIAESPDRTVIWTMRVENDPRGDADFWRKSLHEVLASDFENVATRDVGNWACSTFDEPGADEPYRWQVCLTERGRHVEVVQTYFPGPAQVERFAERVDAALTGGGEA